MILSDRIRATVLTDRQAVYMAVLFGAKTEVPDPEDAVDEFARLLAEAPAKANPDAELLQLMWGVA